MRRIGTAVLLLFAIVQLHAQEKVEQTEAGKKAIARIRQLGGLVLELAQTDQRLDVSYQQIAGPLTDEHLALLKDLKGLVHLNLRGQPVTDAQLAQLKDLKTLVRLHLEKTKVTDKGLENLKSLSDLEYLNLYGTEVSDGGLAHLQGLKKLKNLYLWQSKVTEGGADKLKKALPLADVNLGLEAKVEPKKEEPKKVEPKKVEPKKKVDPKKKDAPKKEEPKKEEPKKEEPKKTEAISSHLPRNKPFFMDLRTGCGRVSSRGAAAERRGLFVSSRAPLPQSHPTQPPPSQHAAATLRFVAILPIAQVESGPVATVCG